MKKIVIIIGSILMLCATNLNGQINYEHTYSLEHSQENFMITNLGNNNYKYVIINFHDSNFSLYNLDFTPFILNISVPLMDTTSTTLLISHITSTLFDCDSTNIEYVVSSPFPNPPRTFYIYRTDGTLLFSKDSVAMPYCTLCGAGGADIEGITNTSTGAKLLLFNKNNQYFVYGLCGTLPENVFDFTTTNRSFVRIFPNPTSNTLTFEINLPDNINDYELIIFDNGANELMREKINTNNNKKVVDVSNYSSGTYFYSLSTKNRPYQSGKFMITK